MSEAQAFDQSFENPRRGEGELHKEPSTQTVRA
jgi:hypothetical protein